MTYTYDDLDIRQLMKLKKATDDIKELYIWALGQEHIKNLLAYAIYETWKSTEKG